MIVDTDHLINVRQAAELLAVHENTVRNWVKDGTLTNIRIPGSKFNKFRKSDIERLRDMRGSGVLSLKEGRRIVGPELITATDLDLWARRRESQHIFPELMRRLLAATPGITSIFVRANEGIALGDWDGSADSEGTAFLPKGLLQFEFSVEKDSAGKANRDWQKRVGDEKSSYSFIFATPRRWGKAQNWANSRKSEEKFTDVRVIDGDVLEGWLQDVPAVHIWISEILGRRPSEAQTIETWWNSFSAATDPILPGDFFVAGRNDQKVRLIELLQQPASIITIESEWDQDIKAFIYGATRFDSDTGSPIPIILVNSSSVWDRLIRQSGSAILIPTFENPNLSFAISSHNHVILMVDPSMITKRPAEIVLPKLDRIIAAESLQKCGLEFTISQHLAGDARRNLRSFIRSHSLDQRITKPYWSQPSISQILAPIVLIGSWTTSSTDIQQIEFLVGKSWSEIELELRKVTESNNDPLFRNVENHWYLTSPSEAFLILNSAINGDHLNRFKTIVLECLLEPDPALDLPTEEQFYSGLRGINRIYSPTIRSGIAQGLTLMGAFGASKRLSDGTSLTEFGGRIVRDILQQINEDPTGRRWQEISDVIQLIAEAAPQEFLDALDVNLSRPNPTLRSIFKDFSNDGSGINSNSPHPFLLWSLETICWSDLYLIDGVRLLAKLSEIDPGGRTINRPLQSLAMILCGWRRNSSASLEQRVQALRLIQRNYPQISWRLLQTLWPSNGNIMFATSTPRFQDWQPNSKEVPIPDWISFMSEIVQQAIELSAADPQRLIYIIENLKSVPREDQDKILCHVENEINSATGMPPVDRLLLAQGLQKLIAKNQRYSVSSWAFSSDTLKRVEMIFEQIMPPTHPTQFAYLFDWDPDIVDFNHEDDGVNNLNYEKKEETVKLLRSQAIGTILTTPDAIDSITQLIQASSVPLFIGVTLAEFDQPTLFELLFWFESTDPKLLEAARSWVNEKASKFGGPWLQAVLLFNEISEKARELIIISLPPKNELWEVLANNEINSNLYWNSVMPRFVQPQDVEYVYRNLMKRNRFGAVLQLLSDEIIGTKSSKESTQKSITQESVIEFLDNLMAAGSRFEDFTQMTSYCLGTLLDFLDSVGVSREKLVSYEIAFIQLLKHYRNPKALNLELAINPNLFVQLAILIYRGADQKAIELSEEDSQRAIEAWWVLNQWNGFPGMQNDGSINEMDLQDWVLSARFAFSESNRSDIGDELIGQTFAHCEPSEDGIWPPNQVRALIETIGSREFENGLIIGRLNSRGITTRGQYDGGNQERVESSRYRDWSLKTKSTWPRTSRVLREIAEQYERDAHRNDVRAELDSDRD